MFNQRSKKIHLIVGQKLPNIVSIKKTSSFWRNQHLIFSRNGNFNQRVEKLTLHQRFRFQRRDCVTYCNSGCYQCGHTSYRGIQPSQFLLSTDKVFGEKKWRHWTTEFPKRIYLIITLYLIILYESIVFIMHQSFMLNIPLFIIYDFSRVFSPPLG